MSRAPAPPTPRDTYTDEPIYWFAVLGKAVETGNHCAAAEAQRQLERLGVRVRYGRPRRQLVTRGGDDAA